jgi:hypothetical protein
MVAVSRAWEFGSRRSAVAVAVLVAIGSWAPSAAAAPGWSIQWTPKLAGASSLAGVSCVSTTACEATGSFAEGWNGIWTLQTAPNLSGGSYLTGVSCTSATTCTAVDFGGVAERWHDGTWRLQTMPTPSGALGGGLHGVSCPSATTCSAVGQVAYRGIWPGSCCIQLPWAEGWNGTSWTIQRGSLGDGLPQAGLSAVSCPSAKACTAVGSDYSAGGTLVERWDGTSWTIQTSPNPNGASSSLSGVSCASATACTAVGYTFTVFNGPAVTLAERWDGTSWRIQATPNPSSAATPDSVLNAVSCASATACTAVGNYERGNGSVVTLAERWFGNAWRVQPTPNPIGATQSNLAAVSCATTTTCVAVGSYTNAKGQQLRLVERWHRAS